MHLFLKKLITLLFAMGVLLTAPLYLSVGSAEQVKLATVNDVPLYKSELDQEMNNLVLRMTQQGMHPNPEEMEKIEKEMTENIINRELLAQKALADGAVASDAVVKKNIESYKKQFPDEAMFKASLDQMGMTEEKLEERVKKGLSIKKLINRDVIQDIKVTEEEMKRHYDVFQSSFMEPEMVKASHILVTVDKTADESQKQQAFEKISTLEARIKNGENFAALAIENSDCPSKTKGGNLGFFRREQMVKPFSDAAFALQVDEVSGIVETQFGYHLIKVTDRKAPQMLTYEKVKDDIRTKIRREKEQKAIEIYVDKLRKDAQIERFPI